MPSASAPLLTTANINGLRLPNRMVVAPMTRISASPDGQATDAMVRYYERFAKGGFGLIVTEGIYTDQAYSQGYANQPGLSDVEQARAWRPVVQAIQAAGGRVVAQLMHAGALSQANRFRDHTVGPSAIRPKGKQMALYRGDGEYPVPREMTEAEITEAIGGFSRAALLAMEVAGFDGVEIHGANGYLLDQFFTDYTNARNDGWGGAIAQRLRITTEVIRAVRQVLGAAVPVGVRISQGKVNDFFHKWQEAEQGAADVFRVLAESSVDYIHITEFEAWRPAFADGGASLVQLARIHAPDVTIIANGSLHAAEQATAALADGADLIALGRGALSNPDWPLRLQAGQPLAEFNPALLSPLGDIKPEEQRG
ncbi:NADH:flavin oxidoreductase [Chania multitudinisentens RB-25]|uniref:NADH:flavin oxidoreductase n=1 Tax=Chania multitudinisentens RB-25 TaxID=1441930 RepID=W0L4G1_9GAMM|nr:NADH:flavin oxidoreductase [Chania multitudinisentens RB-25]